MSATADQYQQSPNNKAATISSQVRLKILEKLKIKYCLTFGSSDRALSVINDAILQNFEGKSKIEPSVSLL